MIRGQKIELRFSSMSKYSLSLLSNPVSSIPAKPLIVKKTAVTVKNLQKIPNDTLKSILKRESINAPQVCKANPEVEEGEYHSD